MRVKCPTIRCVELSFWELNEWKPHLMLITLFLFLVELSFWELNEWKPYVLNYYHSRSLCQVELSFWELNEWKRH